MYGNWRSRGSYLKYDILIKEDKRMKKNRKRIAAVGVAAVLFSALTMTAHAGTAVITSTKACSTDSYTTFNEVGSKNNNSPLYVYIYSSPSYTHRVRALGCATSNNAYQSVNKTYANGQRVNYVTCNKGTKYRVQSMIYEDGYDHAAIAINPLSYASSVTVKWSPDTNSSTTSSYPIATP